MNRKKSVPFGHRPPGPTFASRPIVLIFLAGLVFFLIFLVADWGRRSGAQEKGEPAPKKVDLLQEQNREPLIT